MTDRSKWAQRIQALLAQAESTNHEEEAATFLAKAQELMLRFAIDEAELAQKDPERKTRPIMRTIDFGKFGAGVKAKRQLITGIAYVNRCKVWLHHGRKFLSVAGFEEDVEFVEMLFGSVLVQMEAACTTALRTEKPDGVNSTSFRTSFMYAYTNRVVHRLQEAQRIAEQHEREHNQAGTALVLRDRKAEVDRYVEGRVGKLRKGAGARHQGSAHGAMSGDAHGRRADVSGGRGTIGQRKALDD